MREDTGTFAPSDRPWLAGESRSREAQIRASLDFADLNRVADRIGALIDRNREIHDRECINLNPASNVMNPRAEAALSAGLTTRASLGHAGAKYEMGLEAVEEIEVIAAELATRLFGCRYVELRVGSGALANLYAFMATCRPGDAIIVPPASIGGHVTHRSDGAAGLYGLDIHECPIDESRFTVDVDALARLAERVRPKLITIGTSLNLLPHPVEQIRAVADQVGASVLFDAAHACGMIAGGVWPNPLDQGADLMTMSTYKSLGGPAGGLLLTNRTDLAERVDAIAYPGLTANFDVGKTAALAITLLDWHEYGAAYATEMARCAAKLAEELRRLDVPVYAVRAYNTAGGNTAGDNTAGVHTTSHQLAIDATTWGGGHHAALRLRDANLLTCAIGLPTIGTMGGVRLGTPEAVRIGMTTADMPELAGLVARALTADPSSVAADVSAMRKRFTQLRFVRG